MAEFTPAKCPPGCIFAMRLSSGGNYKREHCGYILIAGQSRKCKPGKGCIRYRKQSGSGRHMRPPELKKQSPKPTGPRKPRTPKWDTAEGRRRWEKGESNRQIAEALGVCQATVQLRKDSYWRKGED